MPTTDLKKKPAIKYQKLAEGLREQIRRGELKPGDRLPSLAEMNEQHNLSRTTVERVHRELEQAGLVVREQGRGTFVAKPVKRTNGLIGFSGHGFNKKPQPQYWTRIIDGLQKAAAERGQGIVLLDLDRFASWNLVDGIVLADPVSVSVESLRKLPVDLPRVSILFETPQHSCVIPNDYQGGQLATEYLLSLGHKRVACLMNRNAYPTNRRFNGYRDALAAAGIEFDARWARDYSPPDEGYSDFITRGSEVMRRWLAEDWHELGCTAILLQNDLVGVGVLNVLREAGISVPGQVSVVGFDNIEVCNCVSPTLTSVDVPLYEMAITAMDIVLREVEASPRLPSTTVLPVRLQIRESTAPPAE